MSKFQATRSLWYERVQSIKIQNIRGKLWIYFVQVIIFHRYSSARYDADSQQNNNKIALTSFLSADEIWPTTQQQLV